MKSLVRAAMTFAILATAQQASAIGVTFNFRVNSSGPSIYPCNAGLYTPERNQRVCFIAGTKERCEPTCEGEGCYPGDHKPKPHGSASMSAATWTNPTPPAYPPRPEKENSCVCSTDGGEAHANYFTAAYRHWDETGSYHSMGYPRHTKKANIVSGLGKFNTLDKEHDSYGNILEKLTFNLGNELYNTSYFVDICYRGPQIDYGDFKTKWHLKAAASLTDFGFQDAGHGYSKLADLGVAVKYICDYGDYPECKGGKCGGIDPDLDPTSYRDNSAVFKDFHHAGLDFKRFWSGENIQHLKNEDLNSYGKAPRFCKVRYVFKERNGNSPWAMLRKWQKHGAQICTYSEIEATDIDPKHGGGHCYGGHCGPSYGNGPH